MRSTLLTVFVAACHFAPAPVVGTGDAGGDAVDAPIVIGLDPPWWDPAWGSRFRLDVTTGSVRPDKGYAAYTVTTPPVAPGALQIARVDCKDLRIVVWSGTAWTELPRHLIGCGSTNIEVRFALPVDLANATTWRDAFIYAGNATAGDPPAVSTTNVYRWFDPATVDRVAQYVHGRMDPWLATGWDDSLAWNAAGYYTYDTGDDTQSSYRIAVDERDVLVEAAWFHTGCYPNNMQSAVCARGIIATGTLGAEDSDHYYCTTRAQNPSCNNTDEAIYDGDIVKMDNETIALYGPNPPPIATNQWRKQALGVFGIAPTQLRFWDSDTGWSPLAWPPASAMQVSGVDNADYQMRGFAGIMVAQDIARVRDIVIRRYVEPEPLATFETEEVRPN